MPINKPTEVDSMNRLRVEAVRERDQARIEAAAYKWAYEYLQSRMESIDRHGWAHDCDGEIESRIDGVAPTVEALQARREYIRKSLYADNIPTDLPKDIDRRFEMIGDLDRQIAKPDAWARTQWQEQHLHSNGGDTPLMKLVRQVWAAALARGAAPTRAVQPPEFQDATWGVDSVMRPCKSPAVSEYAFGQWAEANGIALAASAPADPIQRPGDHLQGGQA